MISLENKRTASQAILDLSRKVMANKDISGEINNWQNYLNHLEFPEESSFQTELKAIKKANDRKDASIIAEARRIYQGKEGGRVISVIKNLDHLLFSRTYHNMSFRLSYKLNPFGRIDFIEVKVMKNPFEKDNQFAGKKFTLLYVTNYKSISKAVNLQDKVITNPLPDFIGLIYGEKELNGFRGLCKELQYNRIINRGYNGIEDLLSSLKKADTLDIRSEKALDLGILPLRDISRDDSTMHFLSEAKDIITNLRAIDQYQCEISYAKRNSN